jgi:flagellar hook-length control protein FliK
MPSRTDIADRARLIHRIAKAFSKMGTDGGQIRMKMHPEELGGVLLEMQVRGRTVEARVTVESEAARGLLQQQLSELRQRLEGQGLTVEKLEVALRDDTTAEDPTGDDRGRHGFAGGDHGFAGQNGSVGIDGFGSKRKGSRSDPDSRIAGAGINTGLANTRLSAARRPAAPGTLDLRL